MSEPPLDALEQEQSSASLGRWVLTATEFSSASQGVGWPPAPGFGACLLLSLKFSNSCHSNFIFLLLSPTHGNGLRFTFGTLKFVFVMHLECGHLPDAVPENPYTLVSYVCSGEAWW